VAELVDAADSKSAEVTPREGSIPFSGTNHLVMLSPNWPYADLDNFTVGITVDTIIGL
jgi:hypothetical protein